ncbi:hypothetical protein OTK49_00280 [Vibrio coralliirubri]|uniref:hypothetical protein n=1 Tax=Vibrio coralliirubri TaxID=1516159 RepID=UPI002283AC55|nr:hypothetical protein [Vibrio coralliirubri]MCY9860977.1 hypothetical protein [Vibrio coralliirubri]
MITDKINETTELMLTYYKKLVELEGAVVSFNVDLVAAKTNDIYVLRVKADKVTKELSQCFKLETGLDWSAENFKTYCEGNITLSASYNNLCDYTKACSVLAKEVLACNEAAMEIANKTFGVIDRKSSLSGKNGKWSKKAKR